MVSLMQVRSEDTILRSPHWLIRGFKDVIESCGLRDFPFNNYQFACERSIGSLTWVEEKFDCILALDFCFDISVMQKRQRLKPL